MTNTAESRPKKITLGNSAVSMESPFLVKKSQCGRMVRRVGLYSHIDLHMNLNSIISWLLDLAQDFSLFPKPYYSLCQNTIGMLNKIDLMVLW